MVDPEPPPKSSQAGKTVNLKRPLPAIFASAMSGLVHRRDADATLFQQSEQHCG